MLTFLLVLFVLLGLIGGGLWVLDPIVQVFDQSKIVDHDSAVHYSVVDKYSKGADATKAEVDLSIIFPAFNEESRIVSTMDKALDFLAHWSRFREWTYEIIVVDDGSTDTTTAVATDYYQRHSDTVRVITLKKNQGKGGAIKVGVQEALGRYILMADADGATDIQDVERLVQEMQHIEEQNALHSRPVDRGMVVGSRAHLAEKSIATRQFYRTVLMKGFHVLVMLLCTRQIEDTQCGFKLLTRSVAKMVFGNLHLFRWAFDIEVIYQAEALGVPMKEVSVNWREVEGSKLIRNKLDVITTSLTMARDMLAVRLAYVLGIWSLPIDPSVKDRSRSEL